MSYYSTITNLPVNGLGAGFTASTDDIRKFQANQLTTQPYIWQWKGLSLVQVPNPAYVPTLSTTQSVISPDTLAKMAGDARSDGLAAAQQAAGAAALEARASASAQAAAAQAAAAKQAAMAAQSASSSAAQAAAAAQANAIAMGAQRAAQTAAADQAAADKARAAANEAARKSADTQNQLRLAEQQNSAPVAVAPGRTINLKPIIIGSVIGVSLLVGAGIYMARKRAAQ